MTHKSNPDQQSDDPVYKQIIPTNINNPNIYGMVFIAICITLIELVNFEAV